MFFAPNPTNEATPLLEAPGDGNSSNDSSSKSHALLAKLQGVTLLGFSRRRYKSSPSSGSGGGLYTGERKSLRLNLPDLIGNEHGVYAHDVLEPADGLSPLVAGGTLVLTDGYRSLPRPPSTVKSLPAYAPFRRDARHRSFYLWWTNEFRHWWKSSRLLVRLAGLWTLAVTSTYIQKLAAIDVTHAASKNTRRALRLVKRLGRGGDLRGFLNAVQPLTRSLRIVVAAWRWMEAAQCRRMEVGVEEAMAFTGNRVSRMLARTGVDLLVVYGVMPLAALLFHPHWLLPSDAWHPRTILLTLAGLRACAPYAASFVGSRAGRVLTRALFASLKDRWQPVMRISQLNLTSDDCCERDEVSENADLAKVAKLVAKALGASQSIGRDGSQNQAVALAQEGFSQIGAGSGGYAVYVCHRRVWTARTDVEGEATPILLHVTPYGPSILDVMPRYIVLEFEDSIDRRGKWSEYLSQKFYEGPPVVEGYCYQGAFFSPHHFAALRAMYDKQLHTFDMACRAMCTPHGGPGGRSPNPPTDLRSLKVFLAEGKKGRKRQRNDRQMRHLQCKMDTLTRQLKSMWLKQTAPSGIILYFEGLDCSGKSSTGGLVQEALEKAGYHVSIKQYNRPPTPAQKAQPWMHRFQVPETSVVLAIPHGSSEGASVHDSDHLWSACDAALGQGLVWDRGPIGDFVFGDLGQAASDVRQDRFREFMEFDRSMYEKNILFCKMLFVTNRDSIAQTLGKRLAQRQMAQDLHTWLQASRGGGESPFGDAGFEGLEEINAHIDPTDFTAFNNYQRNLRIFSNGALNTDAGENPWLVVNTTDRYAARKQLLQAFCAQVQRFHARHPRAKRFLPLSSSLLSPRSSRKEQRRPHQHQHRDTPALTLAETNKGFVRPFPLPGLVGMVGLLWLVFYYAEHTSFGEHVDTFVDWMGTRGPGDDGDDTVVTRLLTAAVLALDV